jgi:hypothetical protein
MSDELKIKARTHKIYRCGFCNTRIVVLDTIAGTVLPVEVKEGVEYTTDDEFDSKAGHVSHLLNCPQLQETWNEKRRPFLQERNPLYMLQQLKGKDLLK